MEIHLNYHIGGGIVRPGDNRGSSLSKADMGAHLGERSHRPVTVFFDPEMERKAVMNAAHRFSLLSRNREEGTFRAFLQPVYDVDTGNIRFYECLLRLRNGDGSYESIHPYLALAESTGINERSPLPCCGAEEPFFPHSRTCR